MSKKAHDDIEVIIDLDKGIELHNEENPLQEITRKDIYENEGMSKTTIQNFKNGKVGNSWKQLFSFLNRNNLKLEDVMTVKKGKKKIF